MSALSSFAKSSAWCFLVSLLLNQIQVVEASSVTSLWYFWVIFVTLLFFAGITYSIWRRQVYIKRNRVCQTTTVVHTTQTSGFPPARPGATVLAAPPYGAPPQPPPYGFQQPSAPPPGAIYSSYTQPQPPAYGFNNPPPNAASYSDPAYPPNTYSNPPPSYQSAVNSGGFTYSNGQNTADPFAQAARS